MSHAEQITIKVIPADIHCDINGRDKETDAETEFREFLLNNRSFSCVAIRLQLN